MKVGDEFQATIKFTITDLKTVTHDRDDRSNDEDDDKGGLATSKGQDVLKVTAQLIDPMWDLENWGPGPYEGIHKSCGRSTVNGS